MTLSSVPPRSLPDALAWVRAGGRLVIATALRVWFIDRRVLARWDAAGVALLREDGDGYRIRQGKGSVYLVPGLLKYVDREVAA